MLIIEKSEKSTYISKQQSERPVFSSYGTRHHSYVEAKLN